MPINTRSNGSKRGIVPKRASNSSQPSTRRQTAAAQSLLSISNSNSRIVRRNGKSQKQIDRGGGSRTKNRTKSPNIDAIAAAEPRPEDTGSDGEIDKNANEAQGEDEEVDEPDFDHTLMDDFPSSLLDLSEPRNPAYVWNYEVRIDKTPVYSTMAFVNENEYFDIDPVITKGAVELTRHLKRNKTYTAVIDTAGRL